MASAFAVTFAGEITARYNDKSREYANKDGQWQLAKKAPGGPKWVHLENWQQRKEWMKSEGLEEAGEAQAGSDGKSVSFAGMPGSWI